MLQTLVLFSKTVLVLPYNSNIHTYYTHSILLGIYRVSGVKHKVEKLCQAFENGAELVDLTDINPNVVANVLKLYMRQLPEPLLTFSLYPEFIRIAESYPPKTSENGGAPNDNSSQLTSQQQEAVIAELLLL